MRLFYTDHFDLPLPDAHRFPMKKYRLLRQRVTESEHHRDDVLLVPPAATDSQLLLCHTPRYLEAVKSGTLTAQEIRRIGFPWSPQMVERSRRSTGATIAASRAALSDGVAANLAGGTHHAFADAGEGYCVFNDAAVAIRTLQHDGSINSACVIERRGRFDLVIYLAGADPYEHDRLGRLKLSQSGLAERDRIVLDWARSHCCPIAVTMSGGYAAEIEDIVTIHANTLKLAKEDILRRAGVL